MRVPFRPPHQIERDLRRISGVSLVWQTEDVDRGACDDEDEALPSYSEWQSYHVFFVSPEGDEFRFEDETIGEDPGDGTETAFSGEGRFGPFAHDLACRPRRGYRRLQLFALRRRRIYDSGSNVVAPHERRNRDSHQRQ